MWVAWAILGCAAGCKHATLPTLQVAVDGQRIEVELADSPAERSQGLMHRKTIGANVGMLFVYPNTRPLSFWMENTSIPLSIAFVDSDGKILNIEPMVPFDRTPVRSEGEALYALEMNRDWFAEHGIEAGHAVASLPGPSER